MPLTRFKLSSIANDGITTDKLDDTSGGFTLPGNQYVKVPVGTTAQRPDSSENGELRYNTNFEKLEQFSNGSWQAVDTPPLISSLSYGVGISAADPDGGETITLTGNNFQSGAIVSVGGTNAASTTVNSSTQITFTTTAKSAGDYDVVVTNQNGLTATLSSGISFNGLPTFSSPPAGKIGDSLAPSNLISTITIVAAEPDSGQISYSVTTGALPSGLSLSSGGEIDGTTPSGGAADTTYSFTVTATDDEGQTNTRNYNLVVLRNLYGNFSIPQSLTFSDDDASSLQRTPSSNGNLRKWTFSTWLKRGDLNSGLDSASMGILSTSTNFIRLNDDGYGDNIRVNVGGQSPIFAGEMRDTNSWYHVLVSYDGDNSTEAERTKVWINGVQKSRVSNNYPAQSQDSSINSATKHWIGQNAGTQNFDGKLAEMHFVDGQKLTPTSFGEFYNGVWVAKQYTGTHGSQGWYLPMRTDRSVDAFNTVTWTGTGEYENVTGVGFQPDLVIFKNRSTTGQFYFADSNRGAGKLLYSPDNESENTYDSYGTLTSFDPDGFTVYQNPSVGNEINANENTSVAWCWKAGQSQLNNDGSRTTTVRANQTAGFSIVNWESTDQNETLGHGLGSAPDFAIFRNREVGTEAWNVYHSSLGNGQRLILNTNAIASNVSIWQNTDPTNSVMYVSGDDGVNGPSGRDFIAYFWTAKAGYSAFGTYQGTDDENGPVVNVGFRPALLIIKCTTQQESWTLIDNTRDGENPHAFNLRFDSDIGEDRNAGHNIAFTDTGFQPVAGDDRINGSAGAAQTYAYAAFADRRSFQLHLDQSSNNPSNDWQPEKTGAYRITEDSPTGTN